MAGRRSRWKLCLLRFRRDKRGAAAVEFAMLALPFFLLLMGMAEVTMMGFAQSSLDFAVQETARRIRTGEVQTDGLTAAEVRADMCETLNWLVNVNCASTLFLDVDRYQSFVDVSNNSPVQNGLVNQADIGFSPGDPSDIVMVRAYFEWQMITPFFREMFGNMADGGRLMSSTMLFRNEPFPDPTP